MKLVPMTQQQYEDIEKFIEWLMREGQEARASRMMNLALAYRFGRGEKEASNVIPIQTYLSRTSADTPSVNRETSA